MASTSPSNSISTTTVVLAVAGTLSAGLLAYAVYFDHKRRSDPEFRKRIKREQKKAARAQDISAKEAQQAQKQKVRAAVEDGLNEEMPVETEDMEQYFMEIVGRGEKMCADGSDPVEAALCFWKALKVYPEPGELMRIYEKTVPEPVYSVLAEMIAIDTSIRVERTAQDAAATVE